VTEADLMRVHPVSQSRADYSILDSGQIAKRLSREALHAAYSSSLRNRCPS
jgi:hypothetical protein